MATTAQEDRALVDFHIRRAVSAAKRKGVTVQFSAFLKRLRARNPAVTIHSSYVLEELVRLAEEKGIALEVDQSADD